MTDQKNESGTYSVGYRCPPRHSQFKPGQSGNPSGGGKRRPKAPRDLLAQLLAEKVTVTEKGKTKRVTKLEVVLRQLINRSVQGDARLMRLLLGLLEQAETSNPTVALDRDDEAIIAELVASLGSEDESNDS